MADNDDLPTFVIETRGGGGTGTFLLGVLVGAAAALLLAPRSGTETQAEIAGAVRRLRDDVEGRVTDARDSVGGRVTRVRDRVSDTVGTVRDGVSTRVQQARAALDAGVDAARDAREELQRRVDDAKRAYHSTLGRNGSDGDAAPADEGATKATITAGKGADVVVVDVATEESTGDLT
ncbi:MAG TPA: YtxH domain-containing protein [Longimicrobium sp.]|nr:YtxH domain-containing protein [Longimicrobium sp.]